MLVPLTPSFSEEFPLGRPALFTCIVVPFIIAVAVVWSHLSVDSAPGPVALKLLASRYWVVVDIPCRSIAVMFMWVMFLLAVLFSFSASVAVWFVAVEAIDPHVSPGGFMMNPAVSPRVNVVDADSDSAPDVSFILVDRFQSAPLASQYHICIVQE